MSAQQPLTNLQVELIKLYALHLSNEQLLEVKQVLAGHFAKQLMHHVDDLWQKQGLTAADMEQWLADVAQ